MKKRETERKKTDTQKETEQNKYTYKEMRKERYFKILLCVFGICIFILLILYFIYLPKITLKGEKRQIISYQQKYIEKGYTATLLGKDIHDKVKVSGKVNTEKVGIYQIYYSAENGILEEKKIRTIHVVDQKKPKITLKGETKVFVCPGKKYKEEGYQAKDEYDGDITKKVEVSKKEDHFIYTVQDSSGNKAIKKRTFVYEDNKAPTLTLKGNSTMYVPVNGEYKEEGVLAKDNCDGDITHNVTIEGSVNTKIAGTYEITYKVTDKNQNESSVKRKVIVYKKTASGCIDPGVIYLTFDDGPQAGTTEKILDVLKDENVKATFFVVGKGNTNVLKREAEEGHTVALHTYSHNYGEVYATSEAYFQDLYAIQNHVKNITGVESKIMRFPGGSSNTISRRYHTGIMTQLTQEVIEKGFAYYDWNIDSQDAGRCVGKDKSCILSYVTSNLSLHKCNMILMHDIKANTADALRDIIHYGKNNGYHFDKITEDTPMIRQRVNN